MIDQKRSFAHHTLVFSQRLLQSIPRPNVFANVTQYVVSPLYRAARFMRSLWNETAVYEMPSGSDINPITDAQQQQWVHGDVNNDEEIKYRQTLGSWPDERTLTDDKNRALSGTLEWNSNLEPLITSGSDQILPLPSSGKSKVYQRYNRQNDPMTRPVYRNADEDNKSKDFFRQQKLPELDVALVKERVAKSIHPPL